jgi:hypothetical protein
VFIAQPEKTNSNSLSRCMANFKKRSSDIVANGSVITGGITAAFRAWAKLEPKVG